MGSGHAVRFDLNIRYSYCTECMLREYGLDCGNDEEVFAVAVGRHIEFPILVLWLPTEEGLW